MRFSGRLWKVLLLVAALQQLLYCAAAKRAAPSRERARPRAAATRNSPAPVSRGDFDDEDDFEYWSGTGSGDGGGEDDNSDEWGSYDEDNKDATDGSFSDDDFGYLTGSSRNIQGKRARPPSSDLDNRDGSYHKDSPDEEKDGFWSNEGDDEDDYDNIDSWHDDDEIPVAKKSRNGRAGSSLSSRPRPSAWTGDSRRSGSRRRPGRNGSRGSLAVSRYQQQRGRRPAPVTRGFAVRMPAVSSAAIASALRRQMGTAREAVGKAGTLAASTSMKLKREVKLAVSGSWESALLKVTWPDDLPPDEALMLSMVEAVQAFKKDPDVTKNSAEHRVLLRKLWAKMSEPDWRTVSKAIYLFHSILRDLPVEHHAILKIFLAKMSREWDKRTGCRYFDLGVLCSVSKEGEAFRSFVDRYGSYVFKRAEGFNAEFQELDSMQDEEGWEHVVTTLAKAQKAIDLGVSCQPQAEEETEVTVLCLKNTALDVHQLWRRFHSALDWVVAEADDGDLFEGVDPVMVEECLNEFKDFYKSRYEEVLTFLLDAEELLGIYGLYVPDLGLPSAHDFGTYQTPTASASMGDGKDGDEDESGSSGTSDDDQDGGGSESSAENSTTAAAAAATTASNKHKRNVSAASPPSAAATKHAAGTTNKIAASRAKAYKASKSSSSSSSGGGLSASGGGGGGSGNGGVSDVGSKAEASVKNGGVKNGGANRGEESGPERQLQSTMPPRDGAGVGDTLETGSIGKKVGGDANSRPAVGGKEEGDEGEESGSDEGSASDEDDEGGSTSSGDDDDDDDDEEEEDSAEEGAVDEHVDDLTYFDDATQPDRSGSSDEEWVR